MKIEGPALRLTIFIGEDDTWHHKPLYHEIVHRAHVAGLAGASVWPLTRTRRDLRPDADRPRRCQSRHGVAAAGAKEPRHDPDHRPPEGRRSP
jgi:hypothetical protein